jgi:hypothetical protein
MPTPIPGYAIWARFSLEQTWGVYDAAASNVWWMRQIDGQSLTLMGTPAPQVLRGADGGNLRQSQWSVKTSFGGRFKTPVYPTQVINYLGSITSPAGSPKKLPSWTVDLWDGIEVHRYLGTTFGDSTFTSDNDRDWMMLESTLTAQQRGTPPTFPEPASTVFPQDLRPYCHQDASGQINIGGSLVTQFKRLSVRIGNKLKPNFFESSVIQDLAYTGRDVDLGITKTATTATGRTNFENQVAVAASFGWSIAGTPTRTLLFNCQGNARYNPRGLERDFNDVLFENLTLEILKDQGTGLDCVASAV